MREIERTAAQQARADRDTVEAGARALRHRTNQDRYAGLSNPDAAYALASVLDLLSLSWATLPDNVRRETLAASELLNSPNG